MAFEFENERILQAGQQVGRYLLVEETRCDEYVREYLAKDENLERTVTVKIIRHSKGYSKEFAAQFLGEARALAQLNHPNILKIFDYGQDQGYLYLVMEHVEGTLLENLLGEPMEWQKAVEILLPVIKALDYAHDKNIIHRDLNPGNILLNADNAPVISNFSLSQIIEEEETRDMTSTNVGLGSPFYMSPEQGKGSVVDYRADIYAVGVILYEMVTGKKIFDAQNSMEVVIKQVTMQPVRPRKYVPELPESIEQVILVAIDKDPDRRYQSMGELVEAIEDARANKKHRKGGPGKKIWMPAAAGVVVLVLALLLVLQNRPGGLAGVLGGKATPGEIAPATEVAQSGPQPTAETGIENTTAPVTETSAAPTAEPAAETKVEPIAFPKYPLVNSGMNGQVQSISVANAGQLSELVRLGYPYVTALAWSETYQKIVGGTSAGVYYYDSTGSTAERFFEPQGWVSAIAISDDERWLATGDRNGVVRVWEFTTGQKVTELSGHSAQITSLDFSPDGKYLLSGSNDKTARYWEIAKASEVYLLDRHNLEVTAVRVSPDGKQIYTASKDFKVFVWDAATGEAIKTLTGSARINDMDVSADGRWLVTGLQSAAIDIWDLTTGSRISTLKDSRQVEPVLSVAFSQQGKLVATGSNDGIIRVWGVNAGMLLKSSSSAEGEGASGPIVDLTYAQNGTQLIGLTDQGNVQVFSSELKLLFSQDAQGIEMGRIAVSPLRDFLLAEVGDDTVIKYSITAGGIQGETQADIPRGEVIFPDNSRILLRLGDDIGIFSTSGSDIILLKTLIDVPRDSYLRPIENETLVAAGAARNIQLWSVISGYSVSASINRYQDACQNVFRNDETFLASGSPNGVFTNADTYPGLCSIGDNPRRVDEAISAEEDVLAIGLDNGKVEVWHVGEETALETISISKAVINAVALTPDGLVLATGDANGVVQIWDATKFTLLATLDHHHAAINDLAFSEDGQILVSSSDDGSVQIWGIP